MGDRAGLCQVRKGERAAKSGQSRTAMTARNPCTLDVYWSRGNIGNTAEARIPASREFCCLALVHGCAIGSKEGRAAVPLAVSAHGGISVHAYRADTAASK